MSDALPRNDLSAPLDQLHSNERVKHESRQLRGTVDSSLADAATGAVDETDTLLTKFFGIYQQDDRDLREERRRAKLEPRYQFMVRVRLPGGVCLPHQWLALDALARAHAGNTLRLTTRQTFQFHGIRKHQLRAHLQGLHAVGLDTIAACGDDNRNVICTANPLLSPAHAAVSELAQRIGKHLLPRTGAYREVFLGEPAVTPDAGPEEPLYGTTYLPRKFKIALAVPPRNDVDVFAHDLGFIAVIEDGRLIGYNVLAGGGMGMTHNQPQTFPRLSEPVGLCRPEDVLAVAEHAMCIQRDFGDRRDRAHARFKYTIEDRGIPWFRAELERRLGRALDEARLVRFTTSADPSGWEESADGLWHFALHVPNGRLADRPGTAWLAGMREIAALHKGVFALTTNQNVIIAGVAEGERPKIQTLLQEHGLTQAQPRDALRAQAMACVALPTCGLAMAESERYLPSLLDKIASVLAGLGLSEQPISVRMSGCPNGCSRPFLAEIALVGKAPGRYDLYLGASPSGQRLNVLYRQTLGEARILEELRAVLSRYARERHEGEAFGDFVTRAAIVAPPDALDARLRARQA
ncbi:MAG TPA: NADPH-dependent assimilatory sulfite reductase hemoprotein subunit [Steroidobacteraceae bacterium]|nr:NADPH-dependent assimilatory sulfite reductase hemoprotein subunit [Steroidobacteraceae bacterium]